jgi:hypothetical protein
VSGSKRKKGRRPIDIAAGATIRTNELYMTNCDTLQPKCAAAAQRSPLASGGVPGGRGICRALTDRSSSAVQPSRPNRASARRAAKPTGRASVPVLDELIEVLRATGCKLAIR